jgi:tetratricopeptide (TPR) repeat protein
LPFWSASSSPDIFARRRPSSLPLPVPCRRRRRSARTALVAALDDPERSVRISALVSLANSARGQLDLEGEARFRRVSREFADAARLRQDDGSTQRDLGFLQLLVGEFDLAADALLNSQRLEPDRASTGYLLGLARLGQGRLNDAIALLKLVPRSDPSYSSAQERLKQLAGLVVASR